jgi:hypothetical protein
LCRMPSEKSSVEEARGTERSMLYGVTGLGEQSLWDIVHVTGSGLIPRALLPWMTKLHL